MAKELILLDLGTVRIKRCDEQNVIVQILVDKPAGTFKNPSTGETIEKPDRQEWVDRGYFSSTKTALNHIYRNDLLMADEVRTLTQYLELDRKIAAMLRPLYDAQTN